MEELGVKKKSPELRYIIPDQHFEFGFDHNDSRKKNLCTSGWSGNLYSIV